MIGLTMVWYSTVIDSALGVVVDCEREEKGVVFFVLCRAALKATVETSETCFAALCRINSQTVNKAINKANNPTTDAHSHTEPRLRPYC